MWRVLGFRFTLLILINNLIMNLQNMSTKAPVFSGETQTVDGMTLEQKTVASAISYKSFLVQLQAHLYAIGQPGAANCIGKDFVDMEDCYREKVISSSKHIRPIPSLIQWTPKNTFLHELMASNKYVFLSLISGQSQLTPELELCPALYRNDLPLQYDIDGMNAMREPSNISALQSFNKTNAIYAWCHTDEMKAKEDTFKGISNAGSDCPDSASNDTYIMAKAVHYDGAYVLPKVCDCRIHTRLQYILYIIQIN